MVVASAATAMVLVLVVYGDCMAMDLVINWHSSFFIIQVPVRMRSTHIHSHWLTHRHAPTQCYIQLVRQWWWQCLSCHAIFLFHLVQIFCVCLFVVFVGLLFPPCASSLSPHTPLSLRGQIVSWIKSIQMIQQPTGWWSFFGLYRMYQMAHWFRLNCCFTCTDQSRHGY